MFNTKNGDRFTAAVFAEAKFRRETGTREEPAMNAGFQLGSTSGLVSMLMVVVSFLPLRFVWHRSRHGSEVDM